MHEDTAVKLSKVGVVMLGVRDLERSLTFYRDTLGLKERFTSPEFAFLDGGGVTIGLRKTPNLKDPVDDLRNELVFEVEDVDAAYRSLSGRGVTFRVQPRVVVGDRHAADFRDPDGHVLSVFGPRKTAQSDA